MLELAIIYALLGIIIKFGKLHKLLIFYKLLSKEEQEQIDPNKMSNGFLVTMLLMSAALLMAYFGGQQIENAAFEMIAIISITLIGVVGFMANKKSFMKNKQL